MRNKPRALTRQTIEDQSQQLRQTLKQKVVALNPLEIKVDQKLFSLNLQGQMLNTHNFTWKQ